ncbi:ATP-binding protein [uncultured Polaribacter sp.]|uniref:GAF domain-containing sensor histidine kinase n=1 Tax=uncultured Polaribacter sp. TaxID=174711 RepID=UPI002635390F|nr:ATP-binding protein [uncultured Polaribacter sp.]
MTNNTKPTSNSEKESFKQEKDSIIKRQLRFQQLLISISNTYINADLSDINKIIRKSLKQIGEFVDADRSYIFYYDFKKNTTSNSYEWCSKGITPEIDNLQDIPIDYISYWVDAHKKGEAFYVEDVSLLPKDGENGLRNILEPQGIKSLITIPKLKNNELIGFVGFDSVKTVNKYSETEKDILFVFANMLVNVIKRKENEEHIKLQEKKKEELLIDLSKKNEALNEYAHAVSHDLKAPLSNIHTLITWFLDDNKEILNKSDLENLDLVLFNVKKMDYLIKGILDYSSVDRLESKDIKISIDSIIQEVLQTLLIPNNIKISVQPNLPNLYGNKWRFKQVFQNLIHNAIKYSDKENGEIEIGFTDQKDHVEFFVKDNGIGIKEQYFDRIFKVFTKLESESSSSGIGLSIVKKIVNYYNGTIWLESKEGLGSTFYFTLLKDQKK